GKERGKVRRPPACGCDRFNQLSMPSIRPMRMRRRTWLVEWVADELTLERDRGFTIAPLTKKGELGPLAALPRFPRLSLSSSRDSLPSRIGKRGKCRAIANDRAISSRHFGKATPCALVLNCSFVSASSVSLASS